MGTRMTIDQLEKMKTHELADLLANVVLLLRRMPDVECKQLVLQVPDKQKVAPIKQAAVPSSSFTRAELNKKTVAELKVLAKELNVLLSGSPKKEKIIDKILARPADGYSEQRAILDL